MAIFSLDELADNAGNSAGNFLRYLADGTANHVCNLYSKYPAAVIPNPADTFVRGMWDNLCHYRPPGSPPPQPPPFTGGQCPGQYIIRVKMRSEPLNSTQYYQPSFWGPISQITPFYREKNGAWQGGITVTSRGSDIQPGQVRTEDFLAVPDEPNNWSRSFSIDSIYLVDGSADNCGDPPPSWYPPVTIPPSAKTTNITYVTHNGGSVSVPVTYIDASLGDFTLNAPIRVDIGGVRFSFNFDGFSIGDDGLNPPTLPPSAGDTINNINTKINNYFSPKNPDSDPSLTKNVSPEVEGKEETKPGIAWLRVDLTKVSDKAQFGVGTPNVYFAGWVIFKKGNAILPRQQINFQSSLFRVPDGADGYGVTFTNGAKGTITTYTQLPVAQT